jgi:hypothetical protein
MQVVLNIPDEFPQEIVNKMLKQFEKQIKFEKKRLKKIDLSIPKLNDTQFKARQDLIQSLNQLRTHLPDKEPDISEAEIVALVKEVREESVGGCVI